MIPPHSSDKMSESKKRKAKTSRKLERMAKRNRVLQLPESTSTLQHAHSNRPKASPEPASVLSKASKKRKMEETVLPVKKRHLHSQDEVRSPVLTDDLIFEIMIRLAARSVGKFRSVCKSWLSIASSPSFIKSHVERSRIARQTIVIAKSRRPPHSKTRLFYANLNAGIDLQEQAPLEMLNQSSMLASCDGMILFQCIPMRRYCIINPLTGHFSILPRTASDFNGFLGFYFHRPSSEYRLLATSLDSNISYVNSVGKSDWRRIHDRRPALLNNFDSVDVGGCLYWLAFKEPLVEEEEFPYKPLPNTVMAFDEEAEVYNLLPLPPSEELKGRGGNLMDFNGELGLWLISDDGIIDFWIKKEGWIKKYSVYHPDLDLELYPKNFTLFRSEVWQVGSTISVKDEELLIAAFRPFKHQFLVHWNLKTGACLVEDVADYSRNLLIQFPFIEALTLPGHSFT